MKTIITLLVTITLLASPAYAFLYSIRILSEEEINALSDKDLVEAYTEAKIEGRASQEFHEAAGFNSGKEYNKRKDLLRYIVYLRKAMALRDIEPLPIDEWLR